MDSLARNGWASLRRIFNFFWKKIVKSTVIGYLRVLICCYCWELLERGRCKIPNRNGWLQKRCWIRSIEMKPQSSYGHLQGIEHLTNDFHAVFHINRSNCRRHTIRNLYLSMNSLENNLKYSWIWFWKAHKNISSARRFGKVCRWN